MRSRLLIATAILCMLAFAAGCGGQAGGSNAQSSPASADTPLATTAPIVSSSGSGAVTITFDQVAVASGAGALRVDMQLKNSSKDPVQCDVTEFSLRMGSATPQDADTSAADTCDPDSIDPNNTGKATMYFNVPGDYHGPVTVILTVNGAVIGTGTTQIH